MSREKKEKSKGKETVELVACLRKDKKPFNHLADDFFGRRTEIREA